MEDLILDEEKSRDIEARTEREILETCGITHTVLNRSELDKAEWHEVSGEMAAAVLPWVQKLPDILPERNTHSVVEIIMPAELLDSEHFMDATKFGPGAKYLDIVNETGHVSHKAAIRFIEESAAQRTYRTLRNLADATLSLTAEVTNQVYLKEIDQSLENIQDTITEIQQFLELDKITQLEADYSILMGIYDHVGPILEYPAQSSSTIATVQNMGRSALANVRFYRGLAHNTVQKILTKGKMSAKDMADQFSKTASYIWAYWLSLQVYSRSRVLEVLLAKNRDSGYLQYIKQDIQVLCEEYRKRYADWTERLGNYTQQMDSQQVIQAANQILGGLVGGILGAIGLDHKESSCLNDWQKIAAALMMAGNMENAAESGKGILLILKKQPPHIFDDFHKICNVLLQDQKENYAQVKPAQALTHLIDALDHQYHSAVTLAVDDERLYMKTAEIAEK